MRKQILDPCSIIRVQTWDSRALTPAGVEAVVGVAWPKKTGSVANGVVTILCVGPTDWLVITADSDASSWLRRLEAVIEDSTFQATNMSQALVRIQIQGLHVRDLLAKGCALDLHPPLFPPGRSARTRFAGMPVIIHCTDISTFECIVTLSYADYLLSWLEDAALEYSVTSE